MHACVHKHTPTAQPATKNTHPQQQQAPMKHISNTCALAPLLTMIHMHHTHACINTPACARKQTNRYTPTPTVAASTYETHAKRMCTRTATNNDAYASCLCLHKHTRMCVQHTHTYAYTHTPTHTAASSTYETHVKHTCTRIPPPKTHPTQTLTHD